MVIHTTKNTNMQDIVFMMTNVINSAVNISSLAQSIRVLENEHDKRDMLVVCSICILLRAIIHNLIESHYTLDGNYCIPHSCLFHHSL